MSEARRISLLDYYRRLGGSVEEAIKAERDGADYVALSPVFNTASKEDAKDMGWKSWRC